MLSVFSAQVSYTLLQTPEFDIDLVSTSSHSCTFDIGARHVLLKIFAGSKQVWTSGQCPQGEASLLSTLHRGVPTVVSIDWNEEHSSPGCPLPGLAANPGTYRAVATDGSSSSSAFVFGIG